MARRLVAGSEHQSKGGGPTLCISTSSDDRMKLVKTAKPFTDPKRLVCGAFQSVMSNSGAATEHPEFGCIRLLISISHLFGVVMQSEGGKIGKVLEPASLDSHGSIPYLG